MKALCQAHATCIYRGSPMDLDSKLRFPFNIASPKPNIAAIAPTMKPWAIKQAVIMEFTSELNQCPSSNLEFR